jgi:hypothetical protein
MKSLLLILSLLGGYRMLAQDIPQKAKTVKDFIPAGWKIIGQASGDLNKDKAADEVVVLMNTDPSNIIHNEGLGVDTMDANPRTLLILFNEGGQYRLVCRSNTFILSQDEPTMADPFSGIEIKNGILDIHFNIWYSAGSWYTSNHTYRFRYQQNDFFLIGADISDMHRASGEHTTTSYNFSTRKKSIDKGNEFEDVAPVPTTWIDLKIKTLKTFKTFSAPFTWDEKDISL